MFKELNIEIKLDKLYLALKQLQNGTSAGPDGFINDYYFIFFIFIFFIFFFFQIGKQSADWVFAYVFQQSLPVFAHLRSTIGPI